MVSEHRLDETMFRPVSKKLAVWRRTPYVSHAERTGEHQWATSGGLALLPRRHLHTESLDPDLVSFCCNGVSAAAVAARWWGCVLRLKSVSVLFIVLYLKTGEELSEFNMSVLQQVFLMTAHFGGPVIIAGDWQMEPGTLVKNPWLAKLGLVVVAAKDTPSTCKAGQARLLDYFVVSVQIQSMFIVEADFAVPWEPHAALRAKLPFRPRSFVLSTLRIPRPLPDLVLEEDGSHLFRQDLWDRSCHNAREYVQKWSNGTGIIGASDSMLEEVPMNQVQLSKDHCYHSTCVEMYATALADVPVRHVRSYLGRGGLPHVSSKPAVHRNFLNDRFMAPHVQVWAQIHSLLGWLLFRAGGRMNIASIHQPICQMRKLVAGISQAWRRDVAPNCAASAWISWIEAITPAAIVQEQLGYSQERVRIWLQRAKAQKARAIAVKGARMKSDFKEWLTKDLETGSAGAHAMVKEEAVPPYVPPDATKEIFSQWANIWQDSSFRPECDEQWCVQLERLVKAACSGSNLSFLDRAKQVANEIEILEDVTLDGVRSAAKSYPDKKKKGIDSWSTSFVSKLPEQALSGFVSTLNGVQCNMCWPIQILLNMVALIPKPLGGERPITKTPMLYRIWSVIRAEGVKAWAAVNVGDYDYAAAGRSALYSGAARCLTNEIAVLSNKHVASLLWDIEKFFDSMSAREVVVQGLRLGYPVLDLILAVSMHIAPRVMILSGVTSPVIYPLVSIIAGCIHSINFARMVLERPVSAVVSEVPAVRTSTFVDDVAQIALGTLQQVADGVVHAGVMLATKLKGMNFKLSRKSVVVSSSSRLSKLIARLIAKHANTTVKVEHSGRDLGVLNNPTNRRRASLQGMRIKKATKRAAKIARLSRTVRRASALAYTGALPAATWGVAVLGMAPTVVRRLRSSMAAASGIVAQGRCPATAIATTMGSKHDPAVAIPTLQVSLWIDLWRGEDVMRATMVRQWATAWDRVTGRTPGQLQLNRALSIHEATHQPVLFESRAKWQRVLGPMTATMAVLYDLGWNLAHPAKWEDPSGQVWIPDFAAQKQPFLDLVAKFASKVVWETAALGWCGKGLQSGVDWSATLALYKHITMVNRVGSDDEEAAFADDPSMEGQAQQWPPNASSWLELFLTGGYWPQERLASIHTHVSQVCPRCSTAVESAFHLLWECPANEHIQDTRVVDSQALILEARHGVHQYPCLWLRGMLPAELVAVNTPYATREELQFVKSVPQCPWQSGVYHTDASGGIYSSLPLIRRCGVGVAFVNQSDASYEGQITDDLFLWGAFSALPGAIHTIVRAELFAILLVAKYAMREGVILVVSDSKINVDAYCQGRQHCMNAAHADLWLELWQLVCDKGLNFRLHWSKGHVNSPEQMAMYGVTTRNMFGNFCADRLAARGAEDAQVCMQDAYNLKWHYALARRVQARAVAILSSVMQRTSELIKQPRAAKIRKIRSDALVLSTQHQITSIARTLHCDKCLKNSGASEKGRMHFLQSPCIIDHGMVKAMKLGDTRPMRIDNNGSLQVGATVLHISHTRMCCYKGLYYCATCGYFASAKAQNLAKECTARGADARKRVARLSSGKLPSGLKEWPNDADKQDMLQLGEYDDNAI